MSTGVSTPAPVDYGAAISQVAGGISSTAQGTVNTSAKYQPEYNALEESNIQSLLFGSPGGQIQTGSTTGWFDPSTGQTSNSQPMSAATLGYQTGLTKTGQPVITGGTPSEPLPGWVQRTTPTFANTPATPGYVNLVSQLNQAAPTINPQGASMVNQLYQNTSADLANGSNPGAGLSRNIEQGILGTDIGTLGGTGDAGAYAAALGMSAFGNQLYQQRLGNSANALTANQNFYNNLDASGFGNTMNMQGAAGPGIFNPYPFAQNVAASQYNAQAAAQIASANNTAALEAAGIKAAGSLIGGAAGA